MRGETDPPFGRDRNGISSPGPPPGSYEGEISAEEMQSWPYQVPLLLTRQGAILPCCRPIVRSPPRGALPIGNFRRRGRTRELGTNPTLGIRIGIGIPSIAVGSGSTRRNHPCYMQRCRTTDRRSGTQHQCLGTASDKTGFHPLAREDPSRSVMPRRRLARSYDILTTAA